MDLVDAANDLAALLESANGKTGLRHPSHARVITPARRKVERVLREYFRRQEAALLSEVKPKIIATKIGPSQRLSSRSASLALASDARSLTRSPG